MKVDHYENFPVASWLCPPEMRDAVQAIYHFARTADDIADEGDAPAADRRDDLAAYRQALQAASDGRFGSRWDPVFAPLADAIRKHRLPLAPLVALLSAFEQDTFNEVHADRGDLLDYCARSANPIGRLLLHLCRVEDASALAQSDAICSALQLVNFWQDLSVDLARGRCYVCVADAQRVGLDATQLQPGADSDASRELLRSLVAWTREMMGQGAPLVHHLPGRFGWELRFVVQGGLCVLDKIEAGGFNALSLRPTLSWRDAPKLAWRAWRMHRLQPETLQRSAALPSDERLS